MEVFRKYAVYLLMIPATFSMLLAPFPIVLLPMLLISALAVIPALVYLFGVEKKRKGKENLNPAHFAWRLLTRTGEYRIRYGRRRNRRVAFLALRMTTIAVFLNLLLFTVLGTHSWLFYIHSFDRELEPLREALVKIAGDKGAERKSE